MLRVISRVLYRRDNILDAKVKRRIEGEIKEILPERTGDFNQSLMELGATVCLPNGADVYKRQTYNGVRYPSVTNVGVKPTIGSYKKNVETHIFDFNKELYGKKIKVEFVKMTRPERKFDSCLLYTSSCV